MVEDAEVDNKTSSITRLAKNLSALVDMAEDAEVGEGDSGDDKMVKRSSFSKKPNILIRYFTFLRSKKIWIFLNRFWLLLKLLVKNIIGKAIKQSFYRATQGSYLNWVL